MKKFVSFFFLVAVNITIIFLIMEVGIRTWQYLVKNKEADFKTDENYVENIDQKNKIEPETGQVTLGSLIRESSNIGRVYEFIPSIKASYLGKHFETNSFGMRDREFRIEKSDEVKRIVGIGDSVMFGWGVSAEDSYLRVLENSLSNEISDYEIETLNFAVPGYNTAMEISTYKNLASNFSPDLVILHFVENDFSIPHFMIIPEDFTSLKKSFLFEQLRKLYEVLSNDKYQDNKPDFVGMDFFGLEKIEEEQVRDQYKYMIGRDGFFRAMDILSKEVCKDQVPVIILVGRLRDAYKGILETASSKYGFQLVEAIPFVNSYVKNNNIENTPEARKKLLWLSKDDPHPNELGHKLYAKALKNTVNTILKSEDRKYLPVCNN